MEDRRRYIDKFEEETMVAGTYQRVERRIHTQQEIERIETVTCHEYVAEHIEMACTVDRGIRKMNKPHIKTQDLKECLQKMKNKKAAGLDGIKPEFYKALVKNQVCLETLGKCLNSD